MVGASQKMVGAKSSELSTAGHELQTVRAQADAVAAALPSHAEVERYGSSPDGSSILLDDRTYIHGAAVWVASSHVQAGAHVAIPNQVVTAGDASVLKDGQKMLVTKE